MQSIIRIPGRVIPFLALLVFSTAAQAAPVGLRVVSDIDDTIKITSVRDPISSVWNTVIEPKAFAGMADLYQAFTKLPGYQAIDYVSGAPQMLEGRVSRFLRKRSFPDGAIHLRPRGEGLEMFKLRMIRELLQAYPDDQFILIGDDQQLDPTVYFTLYLENPGRIKEIYIRSVRQARLPSAVYTFVTAFDVARMEFEFLRMDLNSVETVGEAVISENRDSRVLPQFQSCPARAVVRTFDPRVIDLQKQIDARVSKICKRRGLP